MNNYLIIQFRGPLAHVLEDSNGEYICFESYEKAEIHAEAFEMHSFKIISDDCAGEPNSDRGEIVESRSFEVVTPASFCNINAPTLEQAKQELKEWSTAPEHASEESKQYWLDRAKESHICEVITKKWIVA